MDLSVPRHQTQPVFEPRGGSGGLDRGYRTTTQLREAWTPEAEVSFTT